MFHLRKYPTDFCKILYYSRHRTLGESKFRTHYSNYNPETISDISHEDYAFYSTPD
jgi:hypothetical protein